MTLTKYKDNMELFDKCILWWTGTDQTITGFPIIPAGVTVTPAGTWANDLNLGNNAIVKTFDGSTNYITVSDNAAWTFGTNPFSISMWYRVTNLSDVKWLWHLCTDANNQMFSYINQYNTPKHGPCFSVKIGGSYPVDFWKDETIDTNIWHHVTFVRFGTSWLIYEDGIVVASVTATVTIPDFTSGICIGSSTVSASNRFVGSMKDFMVFSKVLSQDEIVTMMRKTNPALILDNFYPLLPGVRCSL